MRGLCGLSGLSGLGLSAGGLTAAQKAYQDLIDSGALINDPDLTNWTTHNDVTVTEIGWYKYRLDFGGTGTNRLEDQNLTVVSGVAHTLAMNAQIVSGSISAGGKFNVGVTDWPVTGWWFYADGYADGLNDGLVHKDWGAAGNTSGTSGNVRFSSANGEVFSIIIEMLAFTED